MKGSKEMKLRVSIALLGIISLSLLSTGHGSSQTGSSVDPPIQGRNWGLSFGRYNTSRAGYSALPIQVMNVPGGKRGPNEKFKIWVTRVKNNSSKAISAVKFNWYLFDSNDLNRLVQTEQTSLFQLHLNPQAETEVEILITNLEDIPILRDQNPTGIFHLEVAATEAHYEDGSVWLASDLPGKLDLGSNPRP
jgi:hypothetical protein